MILARYTQCDDVEVVIVPAAEYDAASKNAERYRWLRDQMPLRNVGQADVYIRRSDEDWEAGSQIMTPARLDSEIDACMRGTTREQTRGEDGP